MNAAETTPEPTVSGPETLIEQLRRHGLTDCVDSHVLSTSVNIARLDQETARGFYQGLSYL